MARNLSGSGVSRALIREALTKTDAGLWVGVSS